MVLSKLLKTKNRGAWRAQSVKHPTSAQVMISRLVGSSPASGSMLTARGLEPALDSVSPSLSDPPPLMLCLSLSRTNKHSKKFLKKEQKGAGLGGVKTQKPTSCLSFLPKIDSESHPEQNN